MVQTLWKTVSVLQLNLALPYDSAIPFLGIYLREMKTYIHVKIGTPVAALFLIAPKWKQPNVHQLVNE